MQILHIRKALINADLASRFEIELHALISLLCLAVTEERRMRREKTDCVKLHFMEKLSTMADCFLLPLWHKLTGG